jgi:hypothetical protein
MSAPTSPAPRIRTLLHLSCDSIGADTSSFPLLFQHRYYPLLYIKKQGGSLHYIDFLKTEILQILGLLQVLIEKSPRGRAKLRKMG